EPEAGRRLVAHPDVPVIAFTGSKAVGLQIIADAARVASGQREVKKVIAEMGGKNAIIVDDTADLDEAVAGVIASFLGYQGQKCSACSRAIVLDTIHDAFVERLVEAARSVRMGPPEEPGAGLFSRSPRNIARAREEFLVGNLYINRGITGALVGRQPFGGGRLSGIGAKAGGPDYLLQFVSGSVLSENTLRRGFSPELS